MRAWKLGLAVVLALLVITNVIWAYKYVDLAVSFSYQNDYLGDVKESSELLGELIVSGAGDYSQSDVLHLLRQARPDAFIVADDNEISIDGVVFRFQDNRLESVR